MTPAAAEEAAAGCTVFVGNLDWGVKDEQGDVLRSAFGANRIASFVSFSRAAGAYGEESKVWLLCRG
eukprot:SAG31_NODE_5166_length_2704_cov_2.110940_2_plen_67_part_00